MAVIISANTAEFNRSLKGAQNGLSKFTGMISKGLAIAGIAIGTKELLQAGFATAKLAGQAEGVSAAFRRLPDSVRLLEDLKGATHGTVSELELMKRAVQASNFDIELSALPKLLEFATLRAQQTGQSVDYLVDSIVTGIGRKSKLILDNLGISAVALGDKLKGVSTEAATVGDVAKAVGDIASESLGKMAKFSENTQSKTERLAASWDNLKVSIGNAVNQAGLPTFLDKLTGAVDALATLGKPTRESLQGALDLFNALNAKGEATSEQFQIIKKNAEQLGISLVKLQDATGRIKFLIDPRTPMILASTNNEVKKLIVNLEYLKDAQKKVNEAFEKTSVTDSTKLRLLAFELAALDKKIEKLERIKKLVNEEFTMSKPDTKALTGNSGLINMDAVNEYLYVMRRMLAETLKTTEGIKSAFIDIGPGISNVITSIADAAGEAAAGAKDFGKQVLNAVAGFVQQFGSILIATGVAEIAFKTFQGPAMIAAGIALVAAGAAVRATVANRPNLSSSGSSGRSASSAERSTSNSFSTNGFEIMVGGEWRIRGTDLVYIFNRQTQLDGRTNG